MAGPGDDQTEEPTEAHLRKAADKGDRMRSRDLVTALTTASGIALLSYGGVTIFEAARAIMLAGVEAGHAAESSLPWALLAGQAARIFLPVAAICLTAALLASAAGGGIGWPKDRALFDLSRVSPLAGVKRMFGAESLAELAKGLLKAVLIGGGAVWWLGGMLPAMMAMPSGLPGAAAHLGRAAADGLLAISAMLVAAALADVPWQRHLWRQRQMMSRQQLKDESRESDGAPELKSAQRRRRQDLLSANARQAVAGATAVLTNPTEFAVALRYARGEPGAPIVVARGRGAVAAAIRAVAVEHAVPVLEYPELARALYFTARTGQAIRTDLYKAVAAVLAFVYGLRSSHYRSTVDIPSDLLFDGDGRTVVTPTGAG